MKTSNEILYNFIGKYANERGQKMCLIVRQSLSIIGKVFQLRERKDKHETECCD